MTTPNDVTHDEPFTFVRHALTLPDGDLHVLQPDEAAEFPDDGAAEWAPLMPYWAVLWRSGVALAGEVAGSDLAGKRVVELGSGLGVPSLAAARAGATVLATDEAPEALEIVQRSAGENGLTVATACADWAAAEDLVARGPFDLVLAADVLYEESAIPLLESLLPRLGTEVWLADPGRPPAATFLARAAADWDVATAARGDVAIHRLTAARPASHPS